MKAALIHNPTAGRGEASRETLSELLHRGGFTVAYQSSKVGELTAALAEPADLVVVAGGDGTVVSVLTQMPDRSVPVAILPLGTANNIATSFGIGGPLPELVARLRAGGRRRLDIGEATGPWGRSWFVEGVGLGALPRLADNHDGDGGGRSELKAARRALRKLLKDRKPDRVELVIDGQALGTRHLMVEILNISHGGPRLPFAPGIDPGDGLLDVLVLEPGQRKQMREWLKDGAEGWPPLTHVRGRKVGFAWDGTPLHVDDALPPPEDGTAAVEVRLTGQAAILLVPSLDGKGEAGDAGGGAGR